MANLTTLEKQVLEKLFQKNGGYVLNFSDRTMGEFFRDDVGEIFIIKNLTMQAVQKLIVCVVYG